MTSRVIIGSPESMCFPSVISLPLKKSFIHREETGLHRETAALDFVLHFLLLHQAVVECLFDPVDGLANILGRLDSLT